MYQSIEQITNFLPNVPDFVTHALGQPKLVFVSIFIQYPWFYQVKWKTKMVSWFLNSKGSILRGLVGYSVARKMIELLVKVGHNDRWGEWCWPHSELQNSSWAELRSWDEAKGNWLWAGFSPSITWPTDLENPLLYTWNLRPTPPIKKSTSGPTLKGN